MAGEQLFAGLQRLPHQELHLDRFQYAGFWQRLGAHLLDTIVLLPLTGLFVWASEQSRMFSVYYTPFGLLFGVWFNVWLVQRYGGTPGKRLLKLSIKRVDGTAVTYREAWLRYAVMFVLGMLGSVAYLIATLKMSDAEYHSMGYMQRALRLDEMSPSWNRPVMWAMNLWIWGEFIVMLTNEKRRALHDFMAGTVVVRDELRPRSGGDVGLG